MNELTGTGTLIRLILRRDRALLAIWIAVVTLVPVGIAASFATLYPTTAALQAYAQESMSIPATVAMCGPVFSPTLGGLVAWRTGLQSAILIAPVSLLFVIRHTRTEEAAGRLELLGSAVVGRHAPLAAALAVVLVANLAIAAIIAGGLAGLGLPVAGSVALGLSAAATGWVFAAVAGVAAQLAQGPSAARGISIAVFGLAYVVRMAGDMAGLLWLSLLSPLGWVRLTRAFAGEQWWVFTLIAGLVVALSAAAFRLSARRDLGAGLLPPRLGPATASPRLRGPLALAWRLQQGALLALIAGFALLGTTLGAVGQSISGFVDAPQINDWVVQMGACDATDLFLFMAMYILGQIVSVYAILAALRLRSEEVNLRAEPVLATALGRLRWALSHLTFAAIGPTLALAVLGLASGLVYGLSTGDVGHQLPRLLARAMVTLPAIWVMAGLATAAYGLLPRLAAVVSWVALGLFLLLELAWELRQVGQSIFDLSPFAHVHFAREITVGPLIWLTGLAMALAAAGLVGLRRRDVG